MFFLPNYCFAVRLSSCSAAIVSGITSTLCVIQWPSSWHLLIGLNHRSTRPSIGRQSICGVGTEVTLTPLRHRGNPQYRPANGLPSRPRRSAGPAHRVGHARPASAADSATPGQRRAGMSRRRSGAHRSMTGIQTRRVVECDGSLGFFCGAPAGLARARVDPSGDGVRNGLAKTPDAPDDPSLPDDRQCVTGSGSASNASGTPPKAWLVVPDAAASPPRVPSQVLWSAASTFASLFSSGPNAVNGLGASRLNSFRTAWPRVRPELGLGLRAHKPILRCIQIRHRTETNPL